jgi:hypothetical protein
MMRLILKRFITIAMVAALCSVRMVASNAQVTDAERVATTEKLQTSIKVSMNNTPMREIAGQLSKQLGVEIIPAPYLEQHLVSIYCPSMIGVQILDSLADLNDWTWRIIAPGKVSISRHTPEFDRSVAAIPRRMQAAIPRYIRTFLRVSTPDYNLNKPASTLVTGLMDARRLTSDRIARAVAEDQADLLTGLSVKLTGDSKVTFSEMTSAQQRELLVALIFPLFRTTSYELLHGDLLPHVAGVENAFLKLSGGSALMIGSRVSDGKTDTEVGFGTSLEPGGSGALSTSGN